MSLGLDQSVFTEERERLEAAQRKLQEYAASQEQDPNGKSAHDSGSKLDSGKVEVDLITRGFARALWAVAEVGTFGAEKYTRDGWEDVPEGLRRYEDAKNRHMLKRNMGEERDPDSALLHRAHEAWNALALLELELRSRGEDETA